MNGKIQFAKRGKTSAANFNWLVPPARTAWLIERGRKPKRERSFSPDVGTPFVPEITVIDNAHRGAYRMMLLPRWQAILATRQRDDRKAPGRNPSRFKLEGRDQSARAPWNRAFLVSPLGCGFFFQLVHLLPCANVQETFDVQWVKLILFPERAKQRKCEFPSEI